MPHNAGVPQIAHGGIIRRLRHSVNGAVRKIVLAHPSLSGLDRGSGTSGSTAWHNAVRSRLFLTRPEPVDGFSLDPDLRVLKTVKSNYARAGEAIGLRRRDGSSSCAATRPGTPVAAAMTFTG